MFSDLQIIAQAKLLYSGPISIKALEKAKNEYSLESAANIVIAESVSEADMLEKSKAISTWNNIRI